MPATNPAPVRQELPDLVDITAIASHLGVEVRHVRRLVAERRIPYIKPGSTDRLIRRASARPPKRPPELG